MKQDCAFAALSHADFLHIYCFLAYLWMWTPSSKLSLIRHHVCLLAHYERKQSLTGDSGMHPVVLLQHIFISESFLLSRKIKENLILSSGHIFFAPLGLAACCSGLPSISLQDFPFIRGVLCCLCVPDVLIAPQVIQLKPVRNLIDWKFWLRNINWKNKWTKSEWIFYMAVIEVRYILWHSFCFEPPVVRRREFSGYE